MAKRILCLNSGSSSLKFALYEGKKLITSGDRDPSALDEIEKTIPDHIDAIGHRVVHGGRIFKAPQKIDSQVIDRLKSLVPFAPLHLPKEIELIEKTQKTFFDIPQFACFDTSFHHNLPLLAKLFALPYSLFEEGLMRYGFHGLSYEYIVHHLGNALRNKTIIAHVGSGVSLTAILDRQPIDTTMGFSPTGGTMMGTRTGDLDPGVLLYLHKNKEHTEHLVNHESGLLGISQCSSDMKALLGKQDKKSLLAIDLFCYQLAKHIGSLTTTLCGVEQLIFTGGIGENCPLVRDKVCRSLAFLGIKLSSEANEKNQKTISSDMSKCQVLVVPTNEEYMIANHITNMLGAHEKTKS